MRRYSQFTYPGLLIVVCLLTGVFTLGLPQSARAAGAPPASTAKSTTTKRVVIVSTEQAPADFCQALLKAHPELAKNPQACTVTTTFQANITRETPLIANGCPIYDESASETYNGGLYGNELFLEFSYSTCSSVNVNIYYESCTRDTWGYGFSVNVTYCGNYGVAGYSSAYLRMAEDDFTVSIAYNGFPVSWTHNIYIQCDGGASGYPGFWFGSTN